MSLITLSKYRLSRIFWILDITRETVAAAVEEEGIIIGGSVGAVPWFRWGAASTRTFCLAPSLANCGCRLIVRGLLFCHRSFAENGKKSIIVDSLARSQPTATSLVALFSWWHCVFCYYCWDSSVVSRLRRAPVARSFVVYARMGGGGGVHLSLGLAKNLKNVCIMNIIESKFKKWIRQKREVGVFHFQGRYSERMDTRGFFVSPLRLSTCRTSTYI